MNQPTPAFQIPKQWFDKSLPVEKLVDRKQQIKEFTRHLDHMVQQIEQRKVLFEWCGGPGIGKTQLTRLLARECNNRGFPWVRIDFLQAKQKNRNYLLDPLLLFEDIIQALKIQTALATHSWENAINTYRQAYPSDVVTEYSRLTDRERHPDNEQPLWLQMLVDVGQHFQDLLRDLGAVSQAQESRPLVLFFDETEYADEPLVDWLEEWIVEPVMQIEHCVIVWMSRQGFTWKSSKIRNLSQPKELDVFHPEDVHDYVKVMSEQANALQDLSGLVHQFTNGHPSANRVVITQIDNWGHEGQLITSQFISAHQADLYREIYRVFVKGYALQGLHEHLALALQFMAVLRRLDLDLVKIVLKECAAGLFGEEDNNYFSHLLTGIENQKHLLWFGDKERKINPDLCFLIRGYYLACEITVFKHIHKTALYVYRQWLEETPINYHLFIVEELYHLASLQNVGETVDLALELQNRLAQFQGWFPVEQERQHEIEKLQQRLERDQELQSLLKELAYADLEQIIARFQTDIVTI